MRQNEASSDWVASAESGGPGSGRGQLVPGQYILVTSELLPGKSSWSTEKVLFLISTHPRTLGCLHFYVLHTESAVHAAGAGSWGALLTPSVKGMWEMPSPVPSSGGGSEPERPCRLLSTWRDLTRAWEAVKECFLEEGLQTVPVGVG